MVPVRDPAWSESRDDLAAVCVTIRRWVVERASASGVGHIGSALSVVELLTVLWCAVMRQPGTGEPDRDRFILSKGHAALAYYAVLRWLGLISPSLFHTYCQDGSLCGVHPEPGLPGVEFATGSLGQGLSVAVGLALALRRRGTPARVFVVMSDAECNEGQVWEAVMLAAHHRLDNLIAVVDDNRMQALGPTCEILDLTPLRTRFEAFGWHAVDADGHDPAALLAALTAGIERRSRPAVVVARTVQGKGVAFMENRLEWHYRNLTFEPERQALAELGGGS